MQFIHAEEGAAQPPVGAFESAAAEVPAGTKLAERSQEGDKAATALAAAALAKRAAGGAAAGSSNALKAGSPLGGSVGKLSQGSGSTTSSPKQAALVQNSVFDTQNSVMSSMTAFDTLESSYQEMTKGERKQARELVKDFVKGMVRGREFDVITASGELRICLCSLSRKLDKLKLSVGDKDKRVREIDLADVLEVAAGCIDGPDADDRAVTLTLASDECLTFKLPDTEARDQLIACLNMFSNQARTSAAK